jgi:hypothetical protein
VTVGKKKKKAKKDALLTSPESATPPEPVVFEVPLSPAFEAWLIAHFRVTRIDNTTTPFALRLIATKLGMFASPEQQAIWHQCRNRTEMLALLRIAVGAWDCGNKEAKNEVARRLGLLPGS